MPIGTAPRFWSCGCHWFEKLPYGCRDMAISTCLAPNMFLRHRESVVETGQMSSVETRQMSQQQSSVLSQQQTSVLSQQKHIYPQYGIAGRRRVAPLDFFSTRPIFDSGVPQITFLIPA